MLLGDSGATLIKLL